MRRRGSRGERTIPGSREAYTGRTRSQTLTTRSALSYATGYEREQPRELRGGAMGLMDKVLWAVRVVVFAMLPLAFLLSVAFRWGIVRGLALAGAIVLTTFFVAFVLRGGMRQDEEDDGNGGNQDEDEVPPPAPPLLLEVNQPQREEWRN